jgi:hypothetical protein
MLGPRQKPLFATTVTGGPINCRIGRTLEADAAIGSIFGLEDFERFVFVMPVLETTLRSGLHPSPRLFAAGCPGDKNASVTACL